MVAPKKKQFVNLPSIDYILRTYRPYSIPITISHLLVTVYLVRPSKLGLKNLFALKLVLHLIALYTVITTL
jgi:GT2 family glycosyltransferase